MGGTRCTWVNNTIKGKDGTEWSFVPMQHGKWNSINIISNKPGFTKKSSKTKSTLEVFQLLITSEILNIIVEETNRKAEHWCEIKNKVWKKPTLLKFKALLVYFLSGVFFAVARVFVPIWVIQVFKHFFGYWIITVFIAIEFMIQWYLHLSQFVIILVFKEFLGVLGFNGIIWFISGFCYSVVESFNTLVDIHDRFVFG